LNKEAKRWLRTLEEQAAKKKSEELPPGTTLYGRHRPYHNIEKAAWEKGMKEWRELMHKHGYSDQELDEELEFDLLVAQRVEAAGLEELEGMHDIINFLHVHGHEARYPGPGWWEPGDAELASLPHPMPGTYTTPGEGGT
jgi:hypothetical protein